MKIVSVDIIDVKNPLQSAVAKWRPVVVRINTDEGISGFGEVGLAYGVGASAGFGMAQDFAKLLIGLRRGMNSFGTSSRRKPSGVRAAARSFLPVCRQST